MSEKKITEKAMLIICGVMLSLTLSAGFGTGAEAAAKFDLTDFMKAAKKPVGSTLYVWGGGWNAADTGSGEAALNVGVYPNWKKYFNKHKSGYSYKSGKTAWQNGDRSGRLNGLDCSGYVGWAVYNGMSKGRRKAGYVYKSTSLASSLADLGYGKATACTPNTKFKPGDIVSISGHCFIILGTCSDGSVLVMHSTPNGGVQISGTSGAHGDKAVSLAKKYMKNKYPTWYKAFKSEKTWKKSESAYLYGTRFRFKSTSNFTDKGKIRKMSGEEAIKYLF